MNEQNLNESGSGIYLQAWTNEKESIRADPERFVIQERRNLPHNFLSSIVPPSLPAITSSFDNESIQT